MLLSNSNRGIAQNRQIPTGYWDSSSVSQTAIPQASISPLKTNPPPLSPISQQLQNPSHSNNASQQTAMPTQDETRISSKPSLFFNRSPSKEIQERSDRAQTNFTTNMSASVSKPPSETDSIINHQVPSLTYNSKSSAGFQSQQGPEDFSFNSKQPNNVLFKRLHLLNLEATDKPLIPKAPGRPNASGQNTPN